MDATGQALLAAITANPDDDATRVVYADHLERAGDPRGDFVRAHLEVAPLPPDHPDRAAREAELSRLRRGLEPAWLAVIEPERRRFYGGAAESTCACYARGELVRAELHREAQDTEHDGWKRLLDYIEEVAATGAAEFRPGRVMASPEEWNAIVTLPPTIAKLTQVTSLILYGSELVRLPREIGQMTALRELTPYTSYRLHWYPYELTRCTALRKSTVSTRSLYGNRSHKPAFPRLSSSALAHGPTRPCSVCDQPFEDLGRYRVWISLRVATDVLPLLVNACSEACLEQLPVPPQGYAPGPHRGGPVADLIAGAAAVARES